MNLKKNHNFTGDSSIHSLLGDLGLRVFSTLRTIQVPTQSEQAKAASLPHEAALYDLPYHLERIGASIRALKIDPRNDIDVKSQFTEKISRAFQVIFKENPCTLASDSKIRIIASPKSLDIHVSPYSATWENAKSIAVRTTEIERTLPEHKTTSSIVSVLARREAQQLGFDEALLVDKQGIVRETAWANLFWVDKNGTLFTTQSNILPGVTRQLIINDYPTALVDYKLQELISKASEVFVTQSTTGITAVHSIDDNNFEAPGPVTQTLQQMFVQQQYDLAKPILEL